jgi:hypothetical protein
MKRYRGHEWVRTVTCMLLLVAAASSCTRRQDEMPSAITPPIPSDTAITTSAPETPPLPTQAGITQTVQPELEEVELATREFFDLIREGEIEQALSYWDLHADDARNFQRIAQEWHSKGLQFSMGEVTYSGFAAPGDYRDLEVDDPQVTNASVEVSIDGVDYYLMLTQADGAWRMNGLLVRESQ